jgi:hypothetical protein
MSQKYKLFQYCHKQNKVVPIEQVYRERQARDLFIQDEMEPVRNPLNPKEVYTSKSKLRAAYKAAGAVEVGDAYDRGYNPDKERSAHEQRAIKNVMQQIRERMND